MFIGRSAEIKTLLDFKNSKRAELAIIYGRRRIGKSTLIEYIVNYKTDYYFEAVRGLTKKDQITHFLKQLEELTKKKIRPSTKWEDAFDQLTPFIVKGQHVVVFDEFPWMASERSELVALLKYYWDRKWKKNPGVKLILCGSIANFMQKHLVHSQALHNRKTLELKIEPLPAIEAQNFFKAKRSQFEIAKFLMVFGGVPKYLEQIDINKSFEQNLDTLCFTRNSFFANEFETVFKEQFKVTKKYEAIVAELRSGGKTKEQIQAITRSARGGGFGKSLEQLEAAGLIKGERSLSFELATRKSKTQKYKLWDEWLKFYFAYIKNNKTIIQNQVTVGLAGRLIDKSIASYLGLSFELLCQKNITTVLNALQIDPATIIDIGPYFRQASRKTNKPGIQIDLCLIRKGGVLTLIECKFKENPVGTEVIREMRSKIDRLNIPKKMTLEKILISASGVTNELDEANYFHKILGLEAIFGPP